MATYKEIQAYVKLNNGYIPEYFGVVAPLVCSVLYH